MSGMISQGFPLYAVGVEGDKVRGLYAVVGWVNHDGEAHEAVFTSLEEFTDCLAVSASGYSDVLQWTFYADLDQARKAAGK